MLHIMTTNEIMNARDGDTVKVAGLVLVRQRPGTASGICFITIEDETGNANIVVFQKLFEKYRKEILRAKLLMVEGKVQKEGEVIHVVAKRCSDITSLLGQLSTSDHSKAVHTPLRADENGEDM